MTIGSPVVWRIDAARNKARELQRQIDEGRDRGLRAETVAADVASREGAKASALTVGEVWPRYLQEGRPKRRAAWKPRYLADLRKMSAAGGEPKKRGAARPGRARCFR